MTVKLDTIQDYIESFDESIQVRLTKVDETIRAVAPDVTPAMAYGMPAYKYKGKPLVYFGGFAKHIGFYATPSGHEAFAERLSKYKQGKGSVQFPLSEDLPLDLIADIVVFRMQLIDSGSKL